MRKLIQYNLLVIGIVILVYSVAAPLTSTMEEWAFYQSGLSSFSPPGSMWNVLGQTWSMKYAALSFIGGGVALLAGLLLFLFRKNSTQIGAAPAVLFSSGVMLELGCFLLVWESVVPTYHWRDQFLSSSFQEYIPRSVLITQAIEKRLWIALLGVILITIGVIVWLKEKGKRLNEPAAGEEMPEETEEPEKEEVTPVHLEREEWRFTLFCTVMDIRGDYALVKYDDSGVESEVAIALLPFGIDVGDKLKYENYEFERA